MRREDFSKTARGMFELENNNGEINNGEINNGEKNNGENYKGRPTGEKYDVTTRTTETNHSHARHHCTQHDREEEAKAEAPITGYIARDH